MLLEETVSIVSANHRVRKINIRPLPDHGLKLSFVELGDLASEDGGDLVELADHAVGMQQSVAQSVQCGAAVALPIGIKEADHTLGLLKRLNQSVRSRTKAWSKRNAPAY